MQSGSGEEGNTENKETRGGIRTGTSYMGRKQLKTRSNYKGDNSKTEVLRHVDRDSEEADEQGYRRSRRSADMEYRDGYFSKEMLSLVGIASIVITAIVCAIVKVELRELSVTPLIIISILVFLMGVFLSTAPSYVPLFLLTVMMIVGAITDNFSEVVIGGVVFLSTVLAIKEKLPRRRR